MDIITSLKNEKVKLCYSLQNRPRGRRKERKIALEGTRLIRDALERGHEPLFVLYEAKSIDMNLLVILQEGGYDLSPVNAEVMQHISATETPPGAVAVFPMPTPPIPRKVTSALILDNVREPGNVGAMLRSAAAAGVEAVVLSPGCADPYNPKALRAGMGAHFRVPVLEASWEDIAAFIETARLQVYLAAADGALDYAQVDWRAGYALVIGSEAHGISAEAEALNGQRTRIPMAASTESLNASVAASVLLFEAARQRRG